MSLSPTYSDRTWSQKFNQQITTSAIHPMTAPQDCPPLLIEAWDWSLQFDQYLQIDFLSIQIKSRALENTSQIAHVVFAGLKLSTICSSLSYSDISRKSLRVVNEWNSWQSRQSHHSSNIMRKALTLSWTFLLCKARSVQNSKDVSQICQLSKPRKVMHAFWQVTYLTFKAQFKETSKYPAPWQPMDFGMEKQFGVLISHLFT